MRYFTDIRDIPHLCRTEKESLAAVAKKFAFRANENYLSLIDWNDPHDPIARIILPHPDELDGMGDLDPSNEEAYTVLPGLEHKYGSTALLLVSSVCEGICRYCFRKRVFIQPQNDILENLDAALDYLKAHTEITNVLLTGGDPLILSTDKLESLIAKLRQIDHIRGIRIGTRMPVFNPFRILEDPAFFAMLDKYSLPDKKIYIMTHFSHPRELTDVALEAIHQMHKAGAVLTNQCPLIRGVNDNSDVLAELMRKAAFAGIVPYYLFQCRPTLGNYAYTVPIEEGYYILEGARRQVSGLAKRLRYVMSHSSGKIEILAVSEGNVYFKYHRAANDADNGRLVICKSSPDACWFDDYPEISGEYSVPNHFYGPE